MKTLTVRAVPTNSVKATAMECASAADISKLFNKDSAVETPALSFAIELQGSVPCLVVTSGGKRYRFFGAEVSSDG